MINFYKKHQLFSIIIFYIALGIIIVLPAIFLFSKNFALNFDQLSENARYFEVIKSFQNNFAGKNIFLAIYEILQPLSLGYLFHLFFSEPLGYNLFWFCLFPAGAFGGYLLIKEISKIKNQFALIFCGIFFGFLSIIFYPVFLLTYLAYFLIRFFKDFKIKFAILSLIFYLFIVSFNLFFSLVSFLLIITIACFFLYPYKTLRKNKRNLPILAIYFLSSAILFFGKYYFPLRLSNPFVLEHPLFLTNSFDISKFLSLFINQIQLSFLNGYFIITLSILILAFFIFSLMEAKHNRWIIFSFILSFSFFILSFGPYLKISGQFLEPKFFLPYLLLYRFFPYFNQALNFNEFLIFAFFFFLIGLSLGSQSFLSESKFTTKKRIIFSGAILILLIFMAWNFWQPGPSIQPSNQNLKAQNASKIFFISVPNKTDSSALAKNSLNSLSLASNQPIFADQFEFYSQFKVGSPLLTAINNYLNGQDPDYNNLIENNFKETLSSYLQDEQIKYLMLDPKFFAKNDNLTNLLNAKKITKFLKENTSGQWQIDGDKLIYDVKPQENKIIVYQGNGWGKPNLDFQKLIWFKKREFVRERWPLNNAELIIQNNSSQTKNIELFFNAQSNGGLRRLSVYSNDNKNSDFIIGPSEKSYLVRLDNLKIGKNIVKLKIADYSGKTVDLADANRTSSVKILEIKYHETIETVLPKFYNQLDLSGNQKILLLPTETNEFGGSDQFLTYQDLIDNKNQRVSNLSFFANLYFNAFSQQQNVSVLNPDYYYRLGLDKLKEYNLKYLAIDKSWLDENAFSGLIKNIIANFDLDGIAYSDDRFVVLKLKDQNNARQLPLEFSGNWKTSNSGDNNKQNYNVINNVINYDNSFLDEARIIITNPESKNISADLKFKIANFNGKKEKIIAYLNGNLYTEKSLAEIDVSEMKSGEKKDVTIHLDDLMPQKNSISFKVFDENGKEILIDVNNKASENSESTVKMFDFNVARNNAPLEQKKPETDYCSDANRPIFDNYQFSKEFFDDFEDQNYSLNKWIFDGNIASRQFDQQNVLGHQSLKMTDANQIAKNIYGCFDDADVEFMVKFNKWQPGAQLYFNFINNDSYLIANKENKTGQIKFNSLIQGSYISKDKTKNDFSTNFNLNEWNKIRLHYFESGNVGIFINDEPIYNTDPIGQKPNAFQIMVGGTNPKGLDFRIDDFSLNRD